jgi:transaldolase
LSKIICRQRGILCSPPNSNRQGNESSKDLQKFGQSVWLDYIRRNLITSGELQRLIDEDGLRGITSNPAIFEKAISGSNDYADLLKSLQSRTDLDAKARYEILAIRDIQDAADLLRPVYQETKRRDGYVSLEVSPYLGHDTEGSIQEARRLWKAVARENVMIKIPGTPEGLPAIQQISAKASISTLPCSSRKKRAGHRSVSGRSGKLAANGDVSKMVSVASFFISRIDTLADSEIESRLKNAKDAREQAQLKSLLGKVAIANGKQTYQLYQSIFSSARWKKLASQGAQTQRVLWASTSTKNPAYRDVLYVEELSAGYGKHDSASDDRCVPRLGMHVRASLKTLNRPKKRWKRWPRLAFRSINHQRAHRRRGACSKKPDKLLQAVEKELEIPDRSR